MKKEAGGVSATPFGNKTGSLSRSGDDGTSIARCRPARVKASTRTLASAIRPRGVARRSCRARSAAPIQDRAETAAIVRKGARGAR